MRGRKSTRMEAIRNMPPLYHSVPGEQFSFDSSEVFQWLIRQPDVQRYLFDKAKAYMKYDPETGKWAGVNYGD